MDRTEKDLAFKGENTAPSYYVQERPNFALDGGPEMTRHYSAREFFRQMPNALLARYFATRGVLADLDFAALSETKPDDLFKAWLELPEHQRHAMDAELREVFSLSCEKGWCAIRDEASFHLKESPEQFTEFVEKLSALDGHYERAMVAFLDHSKLWQGATLFYHADSLSYWRKRKGLPSLPASVHDDGRSELANRIRDYFHRTEGRGRNCIVEAYRRKDLDYFFAYPEDYSQQSVEWVDGSFARRPHNPAFEVIYVYSQDDGTLDLNLRGAPKAIEPLQAMFADAILGLPELPPDPEDESVYDLNPLRQRDFQFVYERDSGIERVELRKLRLSARMKGGDRITLEADATRNEHAVHDLLDKIGKSVPLNLYDVTLVELSATINVAAGKRAKRVTFSITHPNSCSLKYDDLDFRLREMLVASGIEPKEPAQRALNESALEPAEA